MPWTAGELTAYPHEFRSIMINLIANAMDVMPHGGVLAVSAKPANHLLNGTPEFRATIADNGSGIPASSRYKIFEPFFTTKPATGTGLGLWATKIMIEPTEAVSECAQA